MTNLASASSITAIVCLSLYFPSRARATEFKA
jgi:hypothetical protein